MAKKIGNHSTSKKKKQTFSFTAPTAMSVQLVGGFTHWQEHPIQMRKGASGGTAFELALPSKGIGTLRITP